LVDSDLLKADLEQVFGETIHVLPVPVKKAANIGEVRGRDTLNMWWPGSPRPEKGWKNIKKLVSELASYHQGVFSLTVSSKTVEVVSPNLRTVNNVLTRQEYLSQFQNSELILLPYDSRKYRASTSGIFVEAVIYGKIPLVSEGTWMAYELKKFDLLDLVIDWEGEQLLKVFLGVAKSKRVREKLKLMQSHYEQFHSVENLSKTISRLQKNQDD